MFAEKKLQRKNIFVCPLDWGLGHASRMVPVIESFLLKGCRVYVGASGRSMAFLKQKFQDQVHYFEFGGKTIRYAHGNYLVIKLILQLPSLLFSIRKEHVFLNQWVKKIQPDLIISDNRYGVWHKSIPSIIVTHQLFVILPRSLRFLTQPVHWLIRKLISNFTYCWVPDQMTPPGLSGQLSHGRFYDKRIFIGTMSRFVPHHIHTPHQLAFFNTFYLVILSGPEPQRSILEQKLKDRMQNKAVIWLRGMPEKNGFSKKGNQVWFDHASDDLFIWCLQHSELVIARSGYSTLMDLAVFGKKAVLIPTQGQTEQEYLAQLMHERGFAIRLDQNNLLQINYAISDALKLPGIPGCENNVLMKKAVEEILQRI